MTWEELLILLQSFKDEGMDLSGVVRVHTSETIDPLDLVQSMTTDNLHFVVKWELTEDADDQASA